LSTSDRGFRLRLRIADHQLDLRAAERLDAAAGVDLVGRELRAGHGLLAVIGEDAGHRLDHADLDRLRIGLSQHEARKARDAGRCGGAGGAQDIAAPGLKTVRGFGVRRHIGGSSLLEFSIMYQPRIRLHS